MPHDRKTLSDHPHLNPKFLPREKQRSSVRRANFLAMLNGELSWSRMKLPKAVNRYLPHNGTKQAERQARQKRERPNDTFFNPVV